MFGHEKRRVDMRLGLPLPIAARRPYVTWAIIAVNVLVFVVLMAMGSSTDTGMLLRFGAMFGPLIGDGEYWRLFTAIFLHAGIWHLALNMFGLWIFGRMVESLFGHVRFGTIYLVAGLSGSVVSYLLNHDSIAVGASGAVFGVLGGMTAFFMSQRQLLGSMAQRNISGLLMLAGINLLMGFLLPGIDNWAHLGGLAGGVAIGRVLAPGYELKRNIFGEPIKILERRKPLRHLGWILPVSLGLLALGVQLGNMVQPENSLSEAFKAERAFDVGDYEMALNHVDRALELSSKEGRAYYVRALIRYELGDRIGAADDAGNAVQFGDQETRSKAQELLVRLGLER